MRLDPRAQLRSLTHGDHDDDCWNDARDRLLIEAVDALHDNADIPDELWERLAAHLDAAEALDLFMLAGWYHAVSYAANGARVPLEEGAPRFSDYATER